MKNEMVPITPQGFQKMKDELKRLKSVERAKVINEIEVARAHGDLSENAEYDAAKEKQGQIMSRIAELEDKIARTQVIDPSTLKNAGVVFGATVRLFDIETEEEVIYQIVGAEETNVKEGKISIYSPIGKSLIGKALNDLVEIVTPRGKRELEILEILFR